MPSCEKIHQVVLELSTTRIAYDRLVTPLTNFFQMGWKQHEWKETLKNKCVGFFSLPKTNFWQVYALTLYLFWTQLFWKKNLLIGCLQNLEGMIEYSWSSTMLFSYRVCWGVDPRRGQKALCTCKPTFLSKRMSLVWQANVDKNQYFLIFENEFQIFEIHFLIFEIDFLIFEIHFLIFEIQFLIFKIRTIFRY